MIQRIILFVLIHLYVNSSYSQCPVVNFNIPSTVCLDEQIDIENFSTNGDIYSWDFCEGDLSNATTGSYLLTIPNVSEPRGLDIVKDGNEWYGFVTNLTANTVQRLEFGTDINNLSPNIVELGNVDNLLDGPEPIKILKEADEWYGLIHNGVSQTLVKLSFGTSLSNTPTAAVIASGLGNASTTLDYKISNDSLIIVLANFAASNFTMVNLGSSINNTPLPQDIFTTGSITGVAWTGDISLINDCNKWYGVSLNFFGEQAYLLSFGESLFSTPSITEIGSTIFFPDSPTRVWIEKDNNDFILFGTMSNGNLHRINLGPDLENINPVKENLGNLAVMNRTNSIVFVKESSNWVAFSIDRFDGSLFRINFAQNCFAFPGTSTDFKPKVQFQQAGNYNIGLTVTDVDGNIRSLTKPVTVNSIVAPDIDIGFGDICISSITNFNGVNLSTDQTITNWTWDFGDGSPTEAGQNVSHQYVSSGTYEVILQAESDNTCGQTSFQEVTIFDEPVPDFTAPAGLKCSNQGLLFTNTTPGDFGDFISWTWDFGDGENSTEKDPVHAFPAAGTYNVKLTASIPGCATETTISVDVSEGPAVAYSFTNDCLNNSTTFTNNTTGAGITGYAWDFGDGTTSDLLNPTHTFADPGDYTVILTVDNDLGCSVTNTQTVTVYALPEVAFINELACSNGGTQFIDQTTASEANITGWAWDFGDGNTSTDQNPIHVYQNSGSFPVRLTTTTNFGCSSFLEKTVDVIVGPTVDFAINQVCLGEETQFEDLSEAADGSAITSWFWEIDGQVFTEQNPVKSFTQPGTYQASLTVTSSTFCTATITKDVVINSLPVANFGVLNACVNDIVRFMDESVATGDEIATYDWNFGNLGNSSDPNPVFIFENTGSYNVTLTITTAANCISTVSKIINVLDRPEGAFTTDVSQGPPPLTVNFQNNSTGADNFDWDFGNGESSTVTNPIFTFTDIGVFEVTMVASTDAGCTDTIRKTINIVEPLLDLVLEGMTTLSQDDKTQVSLDIRNNGTLFVNKLEVTLEVGSEATVTETVDQTIAPGELIVYPLKISIANRRTTPYLCATLIPQEASFMEENLANNTFCINLNEESNTISPFPNPSNRLVTVGVVLQESQKVTITMHNAMGQPVLEREIPDAPEGLNEFQVDVSGIGVGIYWMKLQYGNSEEVFRIFVDK